MDHFNLIHTCLNPECLKEEGIEAPAEEQGDIILVLCGLCGRKRDYPKQSLNRESLDRVTENLRGFFAVAERMAPS